MRQTRAIERCPTKVPLARDAAIAEAIRLGWPVVPYNCPNGKDHWHVGANHRDAPVFHNDRERWHRQARNQE